MHDERTLIPVLMVVALALLVPMVLSRFKRLQIPVVVGEILAGIAIGRSGLGLVSEDPTLEVLAALGFAFLMFLSGLEIDFSLLSSARREGESWLRQPVLAGGLLLAGTIGLALAFAVGLTAVGLVPSPWLPALILSTTSLGIVVPVLREKGQSGSVYGQTILLAALMADFVTMVLITVVVAPISGGLTLDVLFIGLLLLAFLLAARYARPFLRWQPLRKTLADLTQATVQIRVRGAIAVMFTFVVLSEVLGAEVILGAFLAGALISLLSSAEDSGVTEDSRQKLDAIGFGFIVPIFFIMVGVRFDLAALLASPSALVLFPLLLVAAFAVKLLPALVLHRVYPLRETLAAGVLLSARLSLIIAASAIGLRLGIITEALNADIVLVAVVTSTVAPILFNRMLPSRTSDAPGKFLVVGAGPTGLMLVQRLLRHGEPVTVIETNRVRAERVRQLGIDVDTVDAATVAGLAAAGIESARALAVTSGDSAFNLRVCETARSAFGMRNIVAYVSDAARIREFEAAGAQVVSPGLAGAAVMDGLLRYPDAFGLLTSLEDDKDIVEVAVRSPACTGRRLREIRLPGDVLILSIRRGAELVVPHGNNRLEAGDRVTLLGADAAVEDAAAMLRGH